MYLVEKAYRNLFKNKGRNSILFVMLALVILASVIGLSLTNAAARIMDETRNYYAGEVSLVANTQKMKADGVKAESIKLTTEDYKKFAESSLLQGVTFYKSVSVAIKNLSLFDDDYVRSEEEEARRTGPALGFNAQMIGLLNGSSAESFANGDRQIVEGAFPSANECMISSDLRDRNKLKLGDTIEYNNGPIGDSKCTVSGIYSDNTEARASENVPSPMNNARNQLIVPIALFDTFPMRNEDVQVFVLKQADQLEAFQAELLGKGLSSYYDLKYDTKRYERAVHPVETLNQVIAVFGLAIFVIGGGIVVLLNLLALRERKYEIGVFRAIGMPKSKVAVLLLGELTILAGISVLLAILVSLFLNQPIADWLIKLIIENDEGAPRGLTQIIREIPASLSLVDVAELLGVAVVLVLIAGLGFIIHILRFDPIKILSERT
ncbi:ABC transporter permease [Paenibacillus koleovorans]|uniref:ABC transporter permease n=1 Tax=Paenibacillus koleovorans TaxID=121608 RepID=UPI000FD951AE|nr:ABC transporter permease [Paenibacillus koleovorans]